MKKNNKRGFLLGEETIKIIISLICIVFLVYLLVSLYYSNVQEAKLKEAQATLKSDNPGSIKTAIERVITGQGNIDGNSETLLIHNPKGWTIFSFASNDLKPNSCNQETCTCICDEVSSLSFSSLTNSREERQALECDEGGSCLIAENLRKFSNIKITESTELLIKNQGGIWIGKN